MRLLNEPRTLELEHGKYVVVSLDVDNESGQSELEQFGRDLAAQYDIEPARIVVTELRDILDARFEFETVGIRWLISVTYDKFAAMEAAELGQAMYWSD